MEIDLCGIIYLRLQPYGYTPTFDAYGRRIGDVAVWRLAGIKKELVTIKDGAHEPNPVDHHAGWFSIRKCLTRPFTLN